MDAEAGAGGPAGAARCVQPPAWPPSASLRAVRPASRPPRESEECASQPEVSRPPPRPTAFFSESSPSAPFSSVDPVPLHSPRTPGSQTHPQDAGHLPAFILQQTEPAPQGLLQVGVGQPALPPHRQQLQGQVWKRRADQGGRSAVGCSPTPASPPARKPGEPGSHPTCTAWESFAGGLSPLRPVPVLVNESRAAHVLRRRRKWTVSSPQGRPASVWPPSHRDLQP